MKNSILTLENVSKSFNQKGVSVSVLQGITTNFRQGVRYAIMGVSGTGKSTLMHLLSGIDQPSQGTIQFNGQSVSHISHQERSTLVAQSIGVVFQHPYLIAELTALENVALPGFIVGHSYEHATAHATQLLDSVGLTDKATSKALTLSGGQQQRVVLARALYHRPAFLVADEPTGSLDEQTAHTIITLISSFCTQFGMGVIISTHDPQIAMSMDYIFKLHNGLLEPISQHHL